MGPKEGGVVIAFDASRSTKYYRFRKKTEIRPLPGKIIKAELKEPRLTRVVLELREKMAQLFNSTPFISGKKITYSVTPVENIRKIEDEHEAIILKINTRDSGFIISRYNKYDQDHLVEEAAFSCGRSFSVKFKRRRSTISQLSTGAPVYDIFKNELSAIHGARKLINYFGEMADINFAPPRIQR